MDRILTVEQMTFCEHEAEKYGVSLAQLMDNAAAQLAEVIASNSSASSKIVLLIGKGNNGGDGLVAANLLAEQGLSLRWSYAAVSLTLTSPRRRLLGLIRT